MEFINNLTGKNIAEKVTEYSELYGEVLLGLHRDVVELQSRLGDAPGVEVLRQKVLRLEDRQNVLEERLRKAVRTGAWLIALLYVIAGWVLWTRFAG